MNYYPIFLDLRQRTCLVVGGGSVATRKISLLLRAQAQVWVVAPQLNHELQALAEAGQIQHQQASLTAETTKIVAWLEDKALVIAATDEPELNASLAAAARARNIPVNVVDQPELCSFISPALVDRSPLLIAISSAGQAPVLARQLRQRLEQWLPQRISGLAAWAGQLRAQVKQQLAPQQRRPFWEQFFFGTIAKHWLAGREQAAQQGAQTLLEEQVSPQLGEVYLVGAGPGDPELLTLRALQLMQQADVILHDRLVSDAVLERARRDAERIFVGKQAGCHYKSQEQIHDLMLSLARQGKRVCRLKGGDPFIFGRGGEEAQFLRQHQIPYQVVPGITAAAGCAAYAGIPLTHRRLAHGVQLLTGHVNGQRSAEEWRMLAHSGQTLVFYMALERIQDVVQGLIEHGGAESSRPVAVIERGTLPEQRVIRGRLSDICHQVARQQPASPALFIVGESTALADELAWFKPLEPEHHYAAEHTASALESALIWDEN